MLPLLPLFGRRGKKEHQHKAHSVSSIFVVLLRTPMAPQCVFIDWRIIAVASGTWSTTCFLPATTRLSLQIRGEDGQSWHSPHPAHLACLLPMCCEGKETEVPSCPPTRLDRRCPWGMVLPLSSGPPHPQPCAGCTQTPPPGLGPRAHPAASDLATSPLVSLDPTKVLTCWLESSDPIADLSPSCSCQVGVAGRIRPDFPEVAPGSRKKDRLHSSPSSG